ncbi:hypothetical protein XENTR_v10005349 [Xenopus tropicalis]|nr:hypothetical protein XENTR_v10005349 [Xenopus tropicalis]
MVFKNTKRNKSRKNKLNDEKKNKESDEARHTPPGTRVGMGFTAMAFTVLGNLYQGLMTAVNPYSWVRSEKSENEMTVKRTSPSRKRKAEDKCQDEPVEQKKNRIQTSAPRIASIVPSNAIMWLQSKATSFVSQASQSALRWWETLKPFIPFPNRGTKRQRSEKEKSEDRRKKIRKDEIKNRQQAEGQNQPCTVTRIRGEMQGIQQRNTANGPEPTRRPAPVETNLSIDRFKIYFELGFGSFGHVLLAKDLVKQRYVALKRIMKNRFMQSMADVSIEWNVLDVARQCRFLTQLNASFETMDSIYLVLDYISGGTLGDFIRIGHVVDYSTIQFIAAEIICGLRFLHSRGFIHRDLKPHNILLHSTGHAEIADFGLAADTRRTGGMAEGFCGTRAYVAPEVSTNCKYNNSVDYYSLGLILFQMATGMEPRYARQRNKSEYLIRVLPELRDIILKVSIEI